MRAVFLCSVGLIFIKIGLRRTDRRTSNSQTELERARRQGRPVRSLFAASVAQLRVYIYFTIGDWSASLNRSISEQKCHATLSICFREQSVRIGGGWIAFGKRAIYRILYENRMNEKCRQELYSVCWSVVLLFVLWSEKSQKTSNVWIREFQLLIRL